jgi:hypothetical protein
VDSIITTMAMVLANWDERRDYLANFEPFVLFCLKDWGLADPVESQRLAETIASEFHLPPIPINTVTSLRERALRDGYLRRARNRKLYVNPSMLDEVPDLRAARTEALAAFNAVSDALRRYAKSRHRIRWSEADAEDAIEEFLEEFSVEMAMAKRGSESDRRSRADDETALTVVYGFARRVLERDPGMFNNLETIVRGSMLTNVIYFRDLGSWTPSVGRLTIFLDTALVMRLLGLATDELVAAACEMTRLAGDFGCPIQVLDHTVNEVVGVLNGVQRGLRKVREGSIDLADLSWQAREVIDHLLRRDWRPGDVQQVIADLDRRLADAGIQIAMMPPDGRGLGLGTNRLEHELRRLRWRTDRQVTCDVQSLVAMHRLRRGRPCRELGDTPALFVTSNEQLVLASQWFFESEGHRSPVPHAMTDVSLTTQLWLRRSTATPVIARKFLIAESFAALNPSSELWERFLDRVARARDDDRLDDRQVKALIFSIEGREGLLEVTHGRPDAVDAQTPSEVLARYEEAIREPVEAEVEQTSRALKRTREDKDEIDRYAEEQARRIAAHKRTIRERERRIAALEERDERRRRAVCRRRRRAAGVAGATVCVAAVGAAALLAGTTDAASVAVLVTLVAALVAALLAWAWEGGFRLGWLIFAGIVLALGLPMGIYAALRGDPSATQAPVSPTVTTTPSRASSG